MVPTLNGRLQTRVIITLVIGGIWTLLITPFLPDGAPIGSSYSATFQVLLLVTFLGVFWELLYHGLQQFRWEKDWPTLFGLGTMINEGLLVWILLKAGFGPDIPLGAFLLDFVTVWLVVWAWVNGPMRIFLVHWRFNGGRLV